jgi:hypothetical protein
MKSFLTSKRFRNLATVVFYLLMALFLNSYIRSLDLDKLSETSISPVYILLAVPFSLLSRVFLPSIWIKVISIYHAIDSREEYWDLNYIYAKAWLGKYIPGKVAWLAGKVYFAMDRGISKTVLGVASLVDTILQLLTAMILGVFFLLVSGAYSNFSTAYNVFFLSSVIIGLITISPPVFNRLISFGYKTIKKKPFDAKYHIKTIDIARIAPLYMAIHALSALPIYFIVSSLGVSLSVIDLVYVSGAFIFAGAVGTFAVFAPSGIGVREGITLLFISSVMDSETALTLVILLRLWTVLLDFIYFGLSYSVSKYTNKK